MGGIVGMFDFGKIAFNINYILFNARPLRNEAIPADEYVLMDGLFTKQILWCWFKFILHKTLFLMSILHKTPFLMPILHKTPFLMSILHETLFSMRLNFLVAVCIKSKRERGQPQVSL